MQMSDFPTPGGFQNESSGSPWGLTPEKNQNFWSPEVFVPEQIEC